VVQAQGDVGIFGGVAAGFIRPTWENGICLAPLPATSSNLMVV